MEPGLPIEGTLQNVDGGPALATSGNARYVDDLDMFSLFVLIYYSGSNVHIRGEGHYSNHDKSNFL